MAKAHRISWRKATKIGRQFLGISVPGAAAKPVFEVPPEDGLDISYPVPVTN